MPGYSGTHAGQHYSSLYPRLYRVQYRCVIAGRTYDVDKIVTATDEPHARDRARRGTMDIRGGVMVEHVGDLEPDAPAVNVTMGRWSDDA